MDHPIKIGDLSVGMAIIGKLTDDPKFGDIVRPLFMISERIDAQADDLTPRLSNSGFSFAVYPSSVVQTGVKSFGCENNTAQELPIQSWNLMRPCVVSASKSAPYRRVEEPS